MLSLRRFFVNAVVLSVALAASLVHASSLDLTLGNPSGATTSTANETNYLINRPQYAVSYHRFNGIPNWSSWHLDSSNFGTAPRSSTFTSDTSLPSGWYRVTTGNYTNSGYDRGHMTPSADRTSSTADNAATFILTNVIPQAPDNNQGPWAQLETYCRDLVNAGNELYITSGGAGIKGSISSGRIVVPNSTWKVIVVLPAGSSDLSRVSSSTRVIAVNLPNQQGIRNVPWRNYRTTVDNVENLTGFNFLSNVSTSIQSVIESRVDTQ